MFLDKDLSCHLLEGLVVMVWIVPTVTKADRVYVSLGTAGTYPGYGPVYRNVPW